MTGVWARRAVEERKRRRSLSFFAAPVDVDFSLQGAANSKSGSLCCLSVNPANLAATPRQPVCKHRAMTCLVGVELFVTAGAHTCPCAQAMVLAGGGRPKEGFESLAWGRLRGAVVVVAAE